MEKENLKKTGIIYFTASILLLAIMFVNVRIAMAGDVSFKSMFASSYSGEGGGEGGEGGGESGESGEGGEGNTPEEKCHNRGGAYNTYLKCVDGGIAQNVQCTISGELSIIGAGTIKGSYSKGSKYTIAWSRYACEEGRGNCCIVKEQGVKVN